MRESEALRRDFRVTAVTKFQLIPRYLHPDYRIRASRKKGITPTGRFLLFRLIPKRGSPRRSFWARWDNAVMKGKPGPPVKIELQHRSNAEQAAFRQGKNAYAGHWPTEVTPGVYHINISDRGTPVFEGTLSLGLRFAWDLQLVPPSEVVFEAYQDGRKVAEIPMERLLPAWEVYGKIARQEEKGKTTARRGYVNRKALRAALETLTRAHLEVLFKDFVVEPPPDTLFRTLVRKLHTRSGTESALRLLSVYLRDRANPRKCGECGRQEVAERRVMVGRTDSSTPITHHECQAGHRFHYLWGGSQQQVPCDCRDSNTTVDDGQGEVSDS